MSDETTEDTSTTAGDAGKSTVKDVSKGTTATSAKSEGLKLEDVKTLMESLLDSRLKTETPEATTRSTSEDSKTYTEEEMQKRINSAVRSRLAEKEEQFTKKVEDAKAQWLQEIQVEFEKQKSAAVQEALLAREIEQERKKLQTELGLTDAQLSRLQGSNADELRADAILLGFAKQEVEKAEKTVEEEKKKAAPKINPGTSDAFITGVSDADDLAALVREGLRQ